MRSCSRLVVCSIVSLELWASSEARWPPEPAPGERSAAESVCEEREKMARKFVASLAHPSVEDLCSIAKANLPKDNPITEEDLQLAEHIFVKEMAVIKGKMSRSNDIYS